MEESDVERGHEFEAAAVEAPALHTSPLLQSEAVNEGVTCRQALKAAKEQCLKIRSFSMLLKYIYDHRQMTLLITVVVGMFALMGSGLVFYYEPLDMAYKNIDTPVLHGYDLVAYFSLGTWSHGVRGKRSISLDNFYNWTDPRDNTTYSYSFWFSNDANRQKFVRDPWKYIPKYGGFSAYRTSTEDFWSAYPDSKVRGAAPFAHPDAFVIKDGKLYMEYSLEYKKLFIQSQNVRTVADHRWISWYGSLESGPLNNFAVRGTFFSEEEKRKRVNKKL